jgi:alkyldihydroxyacetonephosphate synthase
MVMKWWGWGYEDKVANVEGMPYFPQFVQRHLGCETHAIHKAISFEEIELPAPIIDANFMTTLARMLPESQLSMDKLERLRHCYGKSFRDLWRIRNGLIKRAPDVVIYPKNHQEVENIIQEAMKHTVCLIPFGGGTNIVGATEASTYEKRMVVCLDMTRMDRVLHIDSEARLARIEAGMLGPDLEKQLNQKGWTLGHFPDSFEFSTLGGWLATRSAGMQSDQRGNIADNVLALKVVTPQGTIETKPFPHTATGPDINQIFVGSEGTLGVITEAVMKIYPLAERQKFCAILFPNFHLGLQAVKQCAHDDTLPYTMRLQDAAETQLAFSFKPEQKGLSHRLEKIFKLYIGAVKRINFNDCCLMVLGFEGHPKQVELRFQQVLKKCRQFEGVYLGEKPGRRWYAKKYDYPYLRDFVMDFGGVVDVAETATTWGNVATLHANVKKAALAAMEPYVDPEAKARIENQQPGYIGCHLSHNYPEGTCLYFTFAFKPKKGMELEGYLAVKKAATDTIVNSGGTPSHHHSIGYEHAPWLKHAISSGGIDVLKTLKKNWDPNTFFNPGKILVDEHFVGAWGPQE